MEELAPTLGDRLAEEGRQLLRRHRQAPPWLHALAPVLERSRALAMPRMRFERREAMPRSGPPRDEAPPATPDEWEFLDAEPTLVWPAAADEQGRPAVSREPGRPASADAQGRPAVGHEQGRLAAAEAQGRPLAPELRHQLRPLIGPEIDRARLHVGAAADAVARAHGARAVTIGDDIHFRRDAFAPDTPAGRGLLAHELTHVAQGHAPGVDWHRSTPAGVSAEERFAASREHAVAGAAQRHAALPQRDAAPQPHAALPQRSPFAPIAEAPAAPSPQAAAAVASPRGRPMNADADRPPAPAPAPVAMPNLDQLRDSLYRDIMARVRVDFERGA